MNTRTVSIATNHLNAKVLCFGLVIMGVGAAVAFACGPGAGGGGGRDASTTAPGPPAVYVVDSTGTLFSFDAQGNKVATASLPGPVDPNNGGGLTMGPNPTSGSSTNALYVTNGSSSSPVTIYSTDTLSPQVLQGNLGLPAFGPLAGATGMVYDPSDSDFYVASNGGICAWQVESVGGQATTVLQVPPTSEPNCNLGTGSGSNPISLAYSAQTIWSVQRTAAGQDAGPWNRADTNLEQYGVPNPAQQAILATGAQPMSVAICTAAATGATADIEVVGYSGSSSSSAQIVAFLTAAGAPNGGQLGLPCTSPSLTGPYAMSCNAQGVLFVADQSGLYSGKVTSAGIVALGPASPDGSHFVVTPPVYGVFAGDAAIGSTSSCGSGPGGGDSGPNSDGGASGGDGGCPGCTPDTPIPDDIDGGVYAFCEGLSFTTVALPDGGQEQFSGLVQCDQPATCWCPKPNPTGGGSVCCWSSIGTGVDGSGADQTYTQCVDYKGQLVARYQDIKTPWPGDTCATGPIPAGVDVLNCSSSPPGYVIVADPCISPNCGANWCTCTQTCTTQ